MIRAIHPKRNFDPPKFRGVKILDFIILSILNPKAIKMRRPLVQNRNEGEWTKSILRMEISTGPGRVSEMKCRPAVCVSVSQWVCLFKHFGQ